MSYSFAYLSWFSSSLSCCEILSEALLSSEPTLFFLSASLALYTFRTDSAKSPIFLCSLFCFKVSFLSFSISSNWLARRQRLILSIKLLVYTDLDSNSRWAAETCICFSSIGTIMLNTLHISGCSLEYFWINFYISSKASGSLLPLRVAVIILRVVSYYFFRGVGLAGVPFEAENSLT